MSPEGRWMKLASALSGAVPKGRSLKHQKRREASASSWVVLHPGGPLVGDEISIRKANGALQRRFVQSIIVAADRRSDGRCVLAVGRSPPPRASPARASSSPPLPPPALKQRNPRICEDCEGPCRPGAGLCDACRHTPGVVVEAAHQ